MKKKIIFITAILICVLIVIISIYFYNNNFYKNQLLNSWGVDIKNQNNLDVLYESKRGFENDGDRIIKLDSSHLKYEVDCDKCVKDIQIEDDSKLLKEMLEASKLDELISIDDLEIVDSIKKNKYTHGYFKTLIITYDHSKKEYFLFERII